MIVIENGIDIEKISSFNENRIKFRKHNNISMKVFQLVLWQGLALKRFLRLFSTFAKFQKNVPDALCVMAGAGVGHSNQNILRFAKNITENIMALGKR